MGHEPDNRARRKRNAKRRFYVYGGLIAIFWVAYDWQPYEFDLIPRHPPVPNPPVNPDSKALFAKGAKVLVVTAHPDDSEFYIGGTLHLLSKTVELHQIVCTDGDKGYYGIFSNANENRTVRRREATTAFNMNGGIGSPIFLGHPDGRLRADDELVDQIADVIRKLKPDYIFAFDPKYPPRISHTDHRRSGEATVEAVARAGLGNWLLLYSTIAPNYIVDISDVWDDKRRLLAVHASQFHGKKLEGIENMVESLAEEDGNKIGVGLGEGFRCIPLGKR